MVYSYLWRTTNCQQRPHMVVFWNSVCDFKDYQSTVLDSLNKKDLYLHKIVLTLCLTLQLPLKKTSIYYYSEISKYYSELLLYERNFRNVLSLTLWYIFRYSKIWQTDLHWFLLSGSFSGFCFCIFFASMRRWKLLQSWPCVNDQKDS